MICDRFVNSSRAYQGGAGGLGDADVLALHRIGSGGLLPDLTLLIEVSPEVSAARLDLRDGGGDATASAARDAAYHARVAAAFARLRRGRARALCPDRRQWRAASAVHARVLAALARMLRRMAMNLARTRAPPGANGARALARRGCTTAGSSPGRAGWARARFARAAAAELVAEPGVAQPGAGASRHPVARSTLPGDDEEERKRDEGKPFKLKRNITVDQIRRMQRRLTTRPTLGARRAVIIDPADDLEKGAVNALLKSLEEPPAGTFFLLVAHRPGRLLPTIRSRCRMLRFAPLRRR